MYELKQIDDFENLADEIINFSNPKSKDKVCKIIMEYLSHGDLRLESIVECLIEHNEEIFSVMADYMLNNGYIDVAAYEDEDEEEIHTQAMDFLRDKYLGHNPIDVFENLIYETVEENGLSLVMDGDSFDMFGVLMYRVSADARYIDTSFLSDHSKFHINHAQTVMFNMDNSISDGGCWHYGLDNIIVVNRAERKTELLMEGGK